VPTVIYIECIQCIYKYIFISKTKPFHYSFTTIFCIQPSSKRRRVATLDYEKYESDTEQLKNELEKKNPKRKTI